MSTIKTNGLAALAAFGRKPRPEINNLLTLIKELDDSTVQSMIGAAAMYMWKHPRFPEPLSVSDAGLSEAAVELLKVAELINSQGVLKLQRFISEQATRAPARTNAEVIRLPDRA